MQRAQSKALTELTHLFPKEYKEFYQEEKHLQANYSKAQARAKVRLMNLYYNQYRALFKKLIEAGYPRSHSSQLRGGK